MKTETKQRISTELEKQLKVGQTRGTNFAVIFNSKDQPCVRIFNGGVWPIPQSFIAQAGGNAVLALEAERQRQKAFHAADEAQLECQRIEREKRLDEDGFILLAGEDTYPLFAGTWRECRENMWRIKAGQLRRDDRSGLGCWVIAKGDFTPEEGYFNADVYW